MTPLFGSEPASDADRLVTFARELRRIDDYDGLVELVRRELAARLGLTAAWLYVFERDEDDHAKLVAVAGPNADEIRRVLPSAPTTRDWLATALRRDEGPIIVPDARAVEGNPEVARILGTRTVVNVSIGVVDSTLGILGGGTFRDEGPVPIDAAARPYLVHLANLVSVAAARLVLRARDQARARLQAQMAQRQRLESLGLLAGGLAHDFHNLLGVIRTSVGFIAAGPLTDTQRVDLALVADAERSAAALTRKLLMLGRHLPSAFIDADISEVVSQFMPLVARVLPAHIQTELTLAAGLPRLRVDPHQLEQVLMNLVLNARDAMPNGGRLSVVTALASEAPPHEPGSYIQLTVTDTGQGMPPEVLERVFEPFFTTKPVGEGTGLGLAIAWNVIQGHGGVITCRSTVGAGTVVDVRLPVVAPGVPSGVVASTSGVSAVPAAGGSERILLAEDQPHLLLQVARLLKEAGYEVVAVANGAEAVTAAARQAFHLHVLDTVMPVMGGREACDRIRAERPGARFLFTSGYGGDALPAAFLEASGTELVPKPFDRQTLLRAVRRTLDRPAPAVAGVAPSLSADEP